MKKLKQKKFIAVVMSVTMIVSMFTGIGSSKVSAATYKTGQVALTDLKVGDKVYKGVTLTEDRQIAICSECKQIWITKGSDYSTGDTKAYEVRRMEEHKGHYVGYTLFSWYTTSTESYNPMKADVEYTIVENLNLLYKISYSTNGGTKVAETTGDNLPKTLPTTEKEGYDFVGWYTDSACTIQAIPGAAIDRDTTLYAKWKLHEHTYGTTGEERYTCTVCKYIDTTKKENILALEKARSYINQIGKVEYTKECSDKIIAARNAYDSLTENQKKEITTDELKILTDAESTYAKLKADATAKATDEPKVEDKTTTAVKETTKADGSKINIKANQLTLNSKFSIKIGKSIKVSFGKVKGADGYDVYLSYCGKDKMTLVKSTKSSSVTISKIDKKKIDQKNNVKCYVVAYKIVKGKKQEIGRSNQFHAVGRKNKSETEPKNIRLKKTSYVLATGKTVTIKASIVKKNKKLPVIAHTEKLRYATSNVKVAMVSKEGKITAKKKGICYVYVYAINGCTKKVKVTVK